ncbi:hypothetical protein [Pseudogracilibacillus auburnensis]|nr:hypothetical protein [Pseudogracilibacillus auburnensis]MBO1001837.1 hypothetical protein [Pseudogracilibacillus auburnensis]
MSNYKDKWWYSTVFIFSLSLLSILIIPAIAALVLLVIQMIKEYILRVMS